MQLDISKRFEQVDKRLELMQLDMNKRFEQVDKRFEQVDKRFDQQHQEIMGLHHEIKLLMRWSFGALIAVGSLMVAILRLSSFGHS
jgi:Flp pilus assembly protein TadB